MSQIAGSSAAADFERLAGEQEHQTANPAGLPPPGRRCQGITRRGERCTAWTIADSELCAGHAKIGLEAAQAASQNAAKARREARQSVRSRAAESLDEDWPQVLAALRAGIAEGKPSERARAAIGYVQLVYGRQLQQPADEASNQADPLDVASMPKAQRDELKARLLAQHPHLVAELGLEQADAVAETTDAATPTA